MELAQAIEDIRPSIVQISFMATDLPPKLSERPESHFADKLLGTGFIVNSDGCVVTARHVIESGVELMKKFEAARTRNMYVGLPGPNTENMRGNFSMVGFDMVAADPLHDIVILRLKRNPFKERIGGIVIDGKDFVEVGIAKLNQHRPKDGAGVGISGYPLGQTVLVTNAGYMATSWPIDIKDVPIRETPEWFHTIDIVDYYLADVNANPGNSGGPVYLIEDGTVIGVCVQIMGAPVWDRDGRKQEVYYSSGLSVVIPTKYVIELLNRRTSK